jgi:Flp pilus assembly protein TadD
MSMSYGRRARAGALPEVTSLGDALGRVERLALLLAIVALFVYPNPLAMVGLLIVAASAGVRLVSGRLRLSAPVDAWLALLLAGTVVGLLATHHQDAGWLRFTGVVGAAATFATLRGWLQTERDVRLAGFGVAGATAAGILAVLALLRGSLPESSVSQLLLPLTTPFAVFPGVSGDTLDVNARFTVHQYGLAQLLLVAAVFAVSAVALSRRRPLEIGGGAALIVLVPFLLATQARGAFLAFAVAATVVTAFRTRLAWVIPPLSGVGLYVLLQRGTISRGVETEWLNQRLGYWSGTLSLLGDVPFTGSGLGMRTFAEVFAWYQGLPDPYQVSHSHNIVVQAYAEQGILGAIGMFGLMIVGVVIGLRAVRHARGHARWLVAACAGGFLGSVLYGLTDQVPSNNLSLALVLAMLAVVTAADRIWRPAAALSAERAGVRLALPASRQRRVALGLVLIVGVLGLGALAPRWISGIYLNLGSVDLLDASLDPTLNVEARLSRLERADAELTQAVSWNAANVPALRNLGRTRLLRHDLPGATTAIRAAYRPDATPFERTQLARLAYDAGLVDLAIKLYQEGGDETKLADLAQQLWDGRRWHEAALAYAALTELDPDEAEYISNFAKVVIDGGGDDGEALSALLAAVGRKPESARNLARQLVLAGEPYRNDEKRGGGNFESARFWFGLASQVDPTYDRPEVELGSLHFYRGMYQEAADHFREASRRDPRNASTYSQLGETYLKLGQVDQAISFFEVGTQLAIDRPELHANLARAYLQAGRRDDGLREFHQAVDRARDDTPLKAALQDELQHVEAGG